jgi:HD superfamily phosphohydrolase
MYWQVYLHKTVIASEQMLIQVVKRAKKLHKNGEKVFLTPALKFFFDNNIKEIGLINKEIEGETPLEAFSKLDDHDIIVCIKQWQFHQDKVLSILSKGIINRDLFKVTIQPSKFKKKELKEISSKVMKEYKLSEEDLKYFVISDSVKNNAYSKNFGDRINILEKNEKIRDIAVASDVSNVATLSRMVEKFFICHPKL